MVTVEEIHDFLETLVAEGKLNGNAVSMKHVQTTAGLLMAAAEASGDKATALRFRFLAAKAANKHEEYTRGDE
jgi:hypothetical protein